MLVGVAIVAGGLSLAARAPAQPARVTCTVPNDADQRAFTLVGPETGGDTPWVLSFQNKAIAPRTIRVKLAGAKPAIAPGEASLAFKTANGGIMVDLKANERLGTLDVYVSYELEVNVDPEMTPDVDLMNTDGPVAVVCEVVAAKP